jgi:hypothetical protein
VGSLNGRVRRLEERHGMGGDVEVRARATEERRAALATRLERVLEQVEQEERENPSEPSRRRAALKELQEFIERRRRGA